MRSCSEELSDDLPFIEICTSAVHCEYWPQGGQMPRGRPLDLGSRRGPAVTQPHEESLHLVHMPPLVLLVRTPL